MSDKEFTKAYCGVLTHLRDMGRWGFDKGYLLESDVRLTIEARREKAAVLIENGMSQRQAAKELGVSEAQIRRDVRPKDAKPATKGRKNKNGSSHSEVLQDERLAAFDPGPCEDCDTQEDFWLRAVQYAAGEAIAITSPETWSQRYGNWQQFKVTSDLVTLAEQAAEGWIQAAKILKEKAK